MTVEAAITYMTGRLRRLMTVEAAITYISGRLRRLMTVEAAITSNLRTPTPINDSRGRYCFHIYNLTGSGLLYSVWFKFK